MSNFNGRRILILGGSRGLGAALCVWLIEKGADVLCVGKAKPSYQITTKVNSLQLDLSKSQNVRRLIEEAKKYQPDSIIHCLGGGFKRSSDTISKEDFLYLLNLNFLISLEVNNALLPNMLKNNKGWIIHLGSVATLELTASMGYTCVKSLIKPYVRHMGKKYISKGVYFSGVNLGAMTGYGGAMDRLSEDHKDLFENFLENRRPTRRSTPVEELFPYFNLLLSESAKVHASNMISINEAEGFSI